MTSATRPALPASPRRNRGSAGCAGARCRTRGRASADRCSAVPSRFGAWRSCWRRLKWLGQRAARDDHREDVGFLLDHQLDQCRTRWFVGPTQRVFDLARVVDTPPRDTVGGGELHIIGTPDRRARIAATMKELLPLPHHAEVAVVEDRELYLEPFLHHGGDLGHAHLKSTVAGKGPDRLVGTSEVHAHR